MGRPTAIVLCLAVLLSGCGSSGNTVAGTTTSLTIAMGYIPSVQFAPFYVALSRGYYRKAGLDIHFRYGIEPDLLRLASAGKVDLVDSGGDEVLAAVAQGLHVRYVMTQYAHFPAALFSLSSARIQSPADLPGHTIGVPGTYGASYVGLLALLQRAGVPRTAVTIKSIGFTQLTGVSQHKVDAAMGYAMNEPVQLRAQGADVDEIDVYKYADLAGAGLAVGTAELQKHPAAIRRLVAATLHGMRDTLRNPDAAYRISLTQIKGLSPHDRVQRAVLQRCIAFWRPEAGHPVGWIDPGVWSRTAQYLYQFQQIPHHITPATAYTNTFVPGAL